MKKLNVVLRTCDKVSLTSDRIVPKDQCVLRCLKSLVTSLRISQCDYKLIIIDDRSSSQTLDMIKTLAPEAILIQMPERDDSDLNAKQKSRFSVEMAYNYIDSLPVDELVYIIEDDYLHYSDSIKKMSEAYDYFTAFTGKQIGIFPQDFTQLYPHPENKFNETYVEPCYVLPGPDRYYRTTWFTHESFLIPLSVINKYRNYFRRLLDIGSNDHDWEGSTISNVWCSDDVLMLMPIMKTLAIHVGEKKDIPFFNNDFQTLWDQNQY